MARRLLRNDVLRVEPIGRDVRVREVQVHNRGVDRVSDGGRTALNLVGIEGDDLRRGFVLTAGPGVERSDRLLIALRARTTELRHGMPVRLHLGTDQVDGTLQLDRRAAAPLPNGGTTAIVRLDRPIAVAFGDRFVLRRPSPGETLAGGRVLDPLPPRGISRRRIDPPGLVALAAAADGSPTRWTRWCTCTAHCRRYALRPGRRDRGATAACRPQPGSCSTKRCASASSTRPSRPSRPTLTASPWSTCGPSSTIRLRRLVSIDRPQAAAEADAAVERLVTAGDLVRDGDRLKPRGSSAGPSEQLLAAMTRLETALAVPAPPGLSEAARAAGCPPDGIRALEQGGRIVRVEDDLAWETPTHRRLEELAVRLATPGAADAGGISRRDGHEPALRPGDPRGPRSARHPPAHAGRARARAARRARLACALTVRPTETRIPAVGAIVLAGGRVEPLRRRQAGRRRRGRPLLASRDRGARRGLPRGRSSSSGRPASRPPGRARASRCGSRGTMCPAAGRSSGWSPGLAESTAPTVRRRRRRHAGARAGDARRARRRLRRVAARTDAAALRDGDRRAAASLRAAPRAGAGRRPRSLRGRAERASAICSRRSAVERSPKRSGAASTPTAATPAGRRHARPTSRRSTGRLRLGGPPRQRCSAARSRGGRRPAEPRRPRPAARGRAPACRSSVDAEDDRPQVVRRSCRAGRRSARRCSQTSTSRNPARRQPAASWPPASRSATAARAGGPDRGRRGPPSPVARLPAPPHCATSWPPGRRTPARFANSASWSGIQWNVAVERMASTGPIGSGCAEVGHDVLHATAGRRQPAPRLGDHLRRPVERHHRATAAGGSSSRSVTRPEPQPASSTRSSPRSVEPVEDGLAPARHRVGDAVVGPGVPVACRHGPSIAEAVDRSARQAPAAAPARAPRRPCRLLVADPDGVHRRADEQQPRRDEHREVERVGRRERGGLGDRGRRRVRHRAQRRDRLPAAPASSDRGPAPAPQGPRRTRP